MKRNFKKLVTILFTLVLACHLFAVDGVVTYVKGKVEVKRGSRWVSLRVGDKVSKSSMINTGFQSEAKVKLMNSVLYLGPVTRVTLNDLSSSNDRDKVSVYLSTGSVRSKVNRTGDKRVSYTVRTPIAVASVRGTDLTVDSSGYIGCTEGEISVGTKDYIYDKLGGGSSDDSDKAKEKAIDEFEDTPELPKVGVGVKADKNMAVSKGGLSSKPKYNIETGIEKINNAVVTESKKEAVKQGKNEGPVSTTTGNGSVIAQPKTGSISVKVTIAP